MAKCFEDDLPYRMNLSLLGLYNGKHAEQARLMTSGDGGRRIIYPVISKHRYLTAYYEPRNPSNIVCFQLPSQRPLASKDREDAQGRLARRCAQATQAAYSVSRNSLPYAGFCPEFNSFTQQPRKLTGDSSQDFLLKHEGASISQVSQL